MIYHYWTSAILSVCLSLGCHGNPHMEFQLAVDGACWHAQTIPLM